MKNVQNMKPVQVCTGFIFCTFPATVTARHNYRALNLSVSMRVTLHVDSYVGYFLIFEFQCVPISGRGYTLGAYECECRQGYVNPLYPDIQRFDAETMEEEYQSTNGGESPR